jgi:hypothetical protein
MENLFKEERFKAFQKKREELENVMDISDDEEWQEQQKVKFDGFFKTLLAVAQLFTENYETDLIWPLPKVNPVSRPK